VNEPHDPSRTVDLPSGQSDALDAGLAEGFAAPRSSLSDMRPVLLKEAEGESAHVVKPKSDAMPPPEQTGDRYQLQGEIARGGMGAVLRGRDVDLGRDLAVKILLEKHAQRPEVARRFIEEAQIGGQLQHPGVVPVYDIGHFGNRPFFTMKLVKGHTLAALLGEREIPVADAAGSPADLPRFLDIALKVAQTLAYAHAKGVIHRDLKPANIMVGAFGEVQVMDWGLAKVLAEGGVTDEERTSRERERAEDVTTIRTARSTGSAGSFGTNTEVGSLLGTPAYMPPEQANGDVALLDRRADVFGLGAILCEILTGKPPYVGRSSEEVRRKACNGDLADALARLNACGADTELIGLTRVCLSPEAIDRPKDAQAVADGLTGYLNGVQERLHQAELAHTAEVARAQEALVTAAQERKAKEAAQAKAVAERQARRLTLALAATVLLALSLGGGGGLWFKVRREAKQLALSHDVNEALSKAETLRAQARTAPVGSVLLFGQAREQLQRASALVESGLADDSLKAHVRQLQAELDDEEKDRKLVVSLEEARLAQAETLASENRFADERAVPKFRETFAAYGLPAGEGDPAAAAARIRQRPAAIREAIVAALDEWDALAANPKLGVNEPHRQWLRAVLAAVEPAEGWTRQFQAARDEKDTARRKAALEKLAAADDVGTLPARALDRLARQLDKLQAHASAVRLLRRAQQQYPDDFWVNHNLGAILQKVTPPAQEEAVRFLTAAAALRPDSPGVQINLGGALWGKGRLDAAIACYLKAIELDRHYVRAHLALGTVLMDKGHVEAAIACYQKAVELDPKLAWAHNSLGIALQRKGQVDEAIACFRTAIEQEPKDAAGHNNLGHALIRKGQLNEAIACFREALKLAPKLAPAHLGLAMALERKGEVDEAIVCYKKAIELDPKFAQAHNDLGVLLAGKGRLDEAIACYRKAVELDSKSAAAHSNLGNALRTTGRLDEAIAYLKKASELTPKDAAVHTNLGLTLWRKGRVDDAIASYHKALSIDPNDAVALNNLGGILCDEKRDYDGAIACFKKAIALKPKDFNSHHCLGNAFKGKGQVDEAIACYRKAAELNPKDASHHLCLGVLLCDHKKDYDGAIACFRKALSIEPKNAYYHFNLGNALKGKGEVDQAIICYQKALSLDRQYAAAHTALGNMLSRKGKVDEAIASWRKALSLDPKDKAAHRNLGMALAGKGQLEEAIACYQKAIDIDPKFAAAYYTLGNALMSKGQLDRAIACYRETIALDPSYAEAHCNLGSALGNQGRFAESLASLKRGHELGSKRSDWRYPSAAWVSQAQWMATLERKLPAVLIGVVKPKDTTERLGLIIVCRAKNLPHAATGLYTAAFAADPKLADALAAAFRYHAACSAALAASGQGKDAAKLDDKEKARLRKQALDWLRGELTLRTKQVETGKAADRATVRQMLRQWQKDADLTGLRDKAALAKLPAEEQKACTQLWTDVAALLKKAETLSSKEKKQ
jgi:serine/threonine-protein kinase